MHCNNIVFVSERGKISVDMFKAMRLIINNSLQMIPPNHDS